MEPIELANAMGTFHLVKKNISFLHLVSVFPGTILTGFCGLQDGTIFSITDLHCLYYVLYFFKLLS